MAELQHTRLSVDLPASYALERANTDRALLLLHGYADHARVAWKRLLGTAPLEGYNILAPNGLFPCPVRDGDIYKEAYSWYFRNPKSGEQLISFDFAAEALVRLIRQIGLEKLRWTIAGFSQGGYFAPSVVRAGLPAGMLITAGGGFRPEVYGGIEPRVRVHALHGEEDPDVRIAEARAQYEVILKQGHQGTFNAFPGVRHTVDEAGRALIRRLLLEDLR